jgi:hypothetical protein
VKTLLLILTTSLLLTGCDIGYLTFEEVTAKKNYCKTRGLDSVVWKHRVNSRPMRVDCVDNDGLQYPTPDILMLNKGESK